MNKLTTLFTALAVIAAVTVGIKTSGPSHPTSDKDIAATTAMITNFAGNSGGTGVVLTSNATESTVLTNKHVCEVAEYGGLVTTDKHKATVTSYRESEVHDLCLITVNANLEVNTEVAENAPELYDEVTISGHPQLLSTILTKGNFSSKEVIEVMAGMRKCTKDEQEGQLAMLCAFLGGIPVIKTYNAIVSSALIQPGSSGSAAWNSRGKIAALVFAGSGNIGYSHLVPVEYLNNFLKNELPTLTVKFPLDDSLRKLGIPAEKKLRDTCKSNLQTEEYALISQYCKYIDTDVIYNNDNL